MTAHFANTLRRDDVEETEFNDVRAYVVLAQNEIEEFICTWGPLADVHTLFMHGAVNWQLMTVDQDLPNALDYAYGSLISQNKAVVRTCVPNDLLNRTPEDVKHGPWTTDIRIRHEDGLVIDIRGLSDALIFIIDARDGEMKVGSTGSGIQKGELIKRGILEIFGAGALENFQKAFYGDSNSLFVQLREKAVRLSRKKGKGKPPGISTYAVNLDQEDDDLH